MSDIPKIGCIQHDCAECKKMRAEITHLTGELEAAKQLNANAVEIADIAAPLRIAA